MQAYTGFAQVYDTFMDNIPYDKWSEYLIQLLSKYEVSEGLVLDLGCGTGSITERLFKKGYDMIGIDNSEEMLAIALEKLSESLSEEELEEGRRNILYLLQDMREFELYGTVKAVVSICDSMNYILSEEDLIKVFGLVNNYLDTNGVFIFDMNTEYKYEKILADNTIAENREDTSFIWDNYYDVEEKLNEYDLTIYVKEEEDLFRRFDETHYQRAYSLDTIKRLIEEAGMEFVTAYDAFTNEEPKETSERIYIVAREKRQEKKYYTDEQ
ncbi:class I SAM-dependent DNA methyltransferase [Anaeromicropila herbilytica]|uniref:Methyltransferase n=1 Tax=Anaeromicropila herbilytica TaxID=2785025 RepID=A0A7R7ENN2_9FIRM|nr:class I SAM-dependent methyltransferase [Anaeromicropila herbilytica]BCN32143.1 methyltransferase [Anaeromicropila herbilytica]